MTVYYIVYYDKKTEEYVGRIKVKKNTSLYSLQGILGLPHNNPMYDAYKLGPKHLGSITDIIEEVVVFDFRKYDYFVEGELLTGC